MSELARQTCPEGLDRGGNRQMVDVRQDLTVLSECICQTALLCLTLWHAASAETGSAGY